MMDIFCFKLRASYRYDKEMNGNMLDLNKKRKLQAEQLILPLSKHNCWEHRIIFRPVLVLEENRVEDGMITHFIQENAREDGSDPESAKDSNSFVGDSSDSAMSVQGEAKFETKVSIGPSTSSSAGTEGSGRDEMAFVAGKQDPYLQYNELQHPNVGEHTGEFGMTSDYMCSEHGNEGIELYTDKDLEDIFFSNPADPNTFVLSSGRWPVNQEAEAGTIKPTIDQEFEQYFSMLML
ncbi:protein FAR-RED-ELONGATED HYPOCOTYL 1-LIKE isoform X2 [Mercurialis annua]|uniref:protein FAR-RED-ELONGATED HYPOCOTYL 1-LIKE isoform X2 n=1 Tax=Mercurialis annua TaxID=3986 RepID=UPI00215F36E8|nr:protein FAR-RED-ELONGATED HYPOCOTYL 1-LIKE isoform X2 [Mercurialis annua]